MVFSFTIRALLPMILLLTLFLFFLLPDVDNNGFLDDKDFECMAVRAAVIEGKGAIKQDRMDHYKNLMATLWQEISDIADEDRVRSPDLPHLNLSSDLISSALPSSHRTERSQTTSSREPLPRRASASLTMTSPRYVQITLLTDSGPVDM